MKDIPTNEAGEVRGEAVQLNAVEPLRLNLSWEERLAMQTLKQHTSIVILKADKENAVMILKAKDYHAKISVILADSAFR